MEMGMLKPITGIFMDYSRSVVFPVVIVISMGMGIFTPIVGISMHKYMYAMCYVFPSRIGLINPMLCIPSSGLINPMLCAHW